MSDQGWLEGDATWGHVGKVPFATYTQEVGLGPDHSGEPPKGSPRRAGPQPGLPFPSSALAAVTVDGPRPRPP